jgi:hypothetical protein
MILATIYLLFFLSSILHSTTHLFYFLYFLYYIYIYITLCNALSLRKPWRSTSQRQGARPRSASMDLGLLAGLKKTPTDIDTETGEVFGGEDITCQM